MTGQRGLYCVYQIAFHAGLLPISQRSCFQLCLDENFLRMHRQEKEYCIGTGLPEIAYSIDSGQNRNTNVIYNDVRKEIASFRHDAAPSAAARPNKTRE